MLTRRRRGVVAAPRELTILFVANHSLAWGPPDASCVAMALVSFVAVETTRALAVGVIATRALVTAERQTIG